MFVKEYILEIHSDCLSGGVWWCLVVSGGGGAGPAGRGRPGVVPTGAGWLSSLSSTPAPIQTTHSHHLAPRTTHHTVTHYQPHHGHRHPRAPQMLSGQSVSFSQLSRVSSGE